MADPCLPFCHWPTFTDPCDNIAHELVCCIKWTMPCPGAGGEVTCTFDAGVFTDGGSTTYAEMRYVDGLWQPVYLTENELCQTVRQGKILWASNVILGDDPEFVLYPEDYISSGPLDPFVDPYGYTEAGCTGWPDRLTEISGITETDETDDFDIERFALPGLRWSCQTGGMILFEAGWCVWDILTPKDPLGGGGSTGWNSFVPISTGLIDSEWYLRADPFALDGVEETEFAYSSTVTPVVCNYEPCGESIDCFADCISGTVNCDGVTPAHKAVIFFTLNILGCCLNGTYALTYNSAGSHGSGYYGTVTCDAGIAGVHTLEIAVTCCSAASLGSISDTGTLVCLILKMTTTFPSDPPLVWQIVTLVTMSCSGGVLEESSGTITGSDCGLTGNGGWVIHG